ncbi:N-acetylglucosaminyldiphosphoundecaprenol N-acetyl-beta-D-mannosaminyltransferase [Acaryochloris thomasi RCC1774]|uniref:N-acetylglucosaminyldiphosphoundecaprenol N-acetyl-beta-D-mannosaminyltransferase n=1 Tax=Acaryochloris thomasi RCC1774 TaxID=1764569 RepID=A0A2W1JPB0_9CYAN|nr:WecB/TagA/CpsF family glycosyltransferase [Acaryochloris thomasi]PZD73265.1 N-acetylglucosaminyldiphosphoundecaprenol N-acetyl-beta-D-mannosaminyltransferase [Acaryochloris thomasi RCC1774]
MNHIRTLDKIQVIGTNVNALSLKQSATQIIAWAKQNISKTICVANVHMLMEAYWDPSFKQILHSADLVTPDGMPLVWMLKFLGAYSQERVAGMDLLKKLCEEAQQQKVGIFFLGSETKILAKMRQRLESEYPSLDIIGMESLPFRPLTDQEDQKIVERINGTEAGLLFLSLGCPKQEKWIAQHRGRINATMVGLGGVFPVYAGLQKYAPQWIRTLGMEWAYRLYQEPGRLWRRYATTIPPFVWLAARQLITKTVVSRAHLRVSNR